MLGNIDRCEKNDVLRHNASDKNQSVSTVYRKFDNNNTKTAMMVETGTKKEPGLGSGCGW